VSALIGAAILFAGCERGDAADEAATASPDGFDRCTLAEDAEIEAVIGPHNGGKTEIDNMWGLQGCRWTANAVQKSEARGDWHEHIEITVFEDMLESWARGEAEGDPAPDVAPGALYNHLHGTLWFDCGGDRFCAVYVKIDSPERREQAAKQFARLVLTRLR